MADGSTCKKPRRNFREHPAGKQEKLGWSFGAETWQQRFGQAATEGVSAVRRMWGHKSLVEKLPPCRQITQPMPVQRALGQCLSCGEVTYGKNHAITCQYCLDKCTGITYYRQPAEQERRAHASSSDRERPLALSGVPEPQRERHFEQLQHGGNAKENGRRRNQKEHPRSTSL